MNSSFDIVDTNVVPATTGVTFQFVTNESHPELIQQYVTLRQTVFTDFWKLSNFKGGHDKYDDISHTLIVTHNGECVGGVRIIIHEKGSDLSLPLETAEFKLQQLCPELALDTVNYAEFSRFVLLPEFMTGDYSNQLYQLVSDKCRELRISYAFVVTTVPTARRSRRSWHLVEEKAVIREDIEVPRLPTYEGMEMRLSIMGIGDANWPYDSISLKKAKETA